MGLTRAREGRGADAGIICADAVVALMGNPNVGKSTVFNRLTGLERHTGNWTGKTVDSAAGFMRRGKKRYAVVDLPGCYRLEADSPEEEIARGFILSGRADCTVVVCDASALERNLNLVLQTLAVTDRVVVCVNLVDEAAKRGISVDVKRLGELLGAEVVATDASRGKGMDALVRAIERTLSKERTPQKSPSPGSRRREAEEIALRAVTRDRDVRGARQLKLDRFLTGRYTGWIAMTALLALVFFITMEGANYPSRALGLAFAKLLGIIKALIEKTPLPKTVVSACCDGGLATLFTVVSVMLPPMAIFFPLFTLLEDLGLLPRIAFDLDKSFRRCGSCGKQALTSCMGFGCNAAGVIGCRIIESPRERLAAILTNSFIPCNGRFPTLTALISAFFVCGAAGSIMGALWLTLFILLALSAALLMTKLLSLTLLRGKASSFVLELPPFRKPRIGQILVRSMLDRTLFVLGRAAAAAFPAGLLIWALANCGGETKWLDFVVRLIEPAGRLIGLDGATVTAFILGLPANELIMPLTIMIYSGGGVIGSGGVMLETLAAHGWGIKRALLMALLMLFHSPCATTLLTIRRETKSLKWTFAAFALPTALGVTLCFTLNAVWELIA